MLTVNFLKSIQKSFSKYLAKLPELRGLQVMSFSFCKEEFLIPMADFDRLSVEFLVTTLLLDAEAGRFWRCCCCLIRKTTSSEKQSKLFSV